MSAHYLVQYGRLGFVGRFHSDLPLTRGDCIVVRSPRGMELGEVLVSPQDRFAATHDDGEILRPATDADRAEQLRLDAIARNLFTAASDEDSFPLAFIDVETTLDAVAILHALPWDACDVTPLLDDLAARFGVAVRLLDLSRTPVPGEEKVSGGCGKPGCGSDAGGGCSTGSCGTTSGSGCSTGSCSRGSVKSAEELSEYFADLRQKMEAAGLVRTPLN